MDILSIYISYVIPFPDSLPRTPVSHSLSLCFYEGAPTPTHSLPPHCPDILLHWGIEPSQDQGPLLSWMSRKAILCCICGWNLESLHVYSLVGGLVPGSSGGTGKFILLFLLWGCKPLQLLVSFLWLLHWGPCAQSNGWL